MRGPANGQLKKWASRTPAGNPYGDGTLSAFTEVTGAIVGTTERSLPVCDLIGRATRRPAARRIPAPGGRRWFRRRGGDAGSRAGRGGRPPDLRGRGGRC